VAGNGERNAATIQYRDSIINLAEEKWRSVGWRPMSVAKLRRNRRINLVIFNIVAAILRRPRRNVACQLSSQLWLIGYNRSSAAGNDVFNVCTMKMYLSNLASL